MIQDTIGQKAAHLHAALYLYPAGGGEGWLCRAGLVGNGSGGRKGRTRRCTARAAGGLRRVGFGRPSGRGAALRLCFVRSAAPGVWALARRLKQCGSRPLSPSRPVAVPPLPERSAGTGQLATRRNCIVAAAPGALRPAEREGEPWGCSPPKHRVLSRAGPRYRQGWCWGAQRGGGSLCHTFGAEDPFAAWTWWRLKNPSLLARFLLVLVVLEEKDDAGDLLATAGGRPGRLTWRRGSELSGGLGPGVLLRLRLAQQLPSY